MNVTLRCGPDFVSLRAVLCIFICFSTSTTYELLVYDCSLHSVRRGDYVAQLILLEILAATTVTWRMGWGIACL